MSDRRHDDVICVYGPPPANIDNPCPNLASGQPEGFDPADIPHPKRHNLEPFRDSSKTRVLRFWLNIIFMLGAVAGLVLYFYIEEREASKWVLVVSCVFKFVELALRILKI